MPPQYGGHDVKGLNYRTTLDTLIANRGVIHMEDYFGGIFQGKVVPVPQPNRRSPISQYEAKALEMARSMASPATAVSPSAAVSAETTTIPSPNAANNRAKFMEICGHCGCMADEMVNRFHDKNWRIWFLLLDGKSPANTPGISPEDIIYADRKMTTIMSTCE